MAPLSEDKNVVLIGMPGVGKSTVGVLLAKAMSRAFTDTDVHIQASEARRLQSIIDSDGAEAFEALEERYVLLLDCTGCVVATGGSVVYGARAMAHLRDMGVIVHLTLPLPLLEQRLTDLDSRGVVMAKDATLAALYNERMPLYARYADVTVDCTGVTHDQAVLKILDALTNCEGDSSGG